MIKQGEAGGRPPGWQRVLVAGSGLASLRAGQACTELGLAWCHDPLASTPDALAAGAEALGCDAIHPGEMDLAEQLALAWRCREAGLGFIGPRESLLAAMQDPQACRLLMREAGLPLAAGQDSSCVNLPVLVDRHGQALALVEYEAASAGYALAPSEKLTPEQRAYLGQLAVKGALAVELVGLATLRFSLHDHQLGFVSMRPGLSGSEGLVEALTGLDLAVEQLRLAAGQRLKRPRVGLMGHGPGRPGQARLRCLAGALGMLGGGPGVRLDRAAGSEAARLVVWGRDAAEARRRERRALSELLGAGETV
ncbi:ATP-binding protein [Halomonas sp. E14]|uniref:ATP-binding protein n=1 Tax=Halomonas sp. E14 TaxID=3397245 RepID=UPI00403E4D9B